MDRTQDGNAAAHALACSVCHAHVAQPSLSAHSAQHAAAEAVTLVPPSSACPTPMLATTAPHVGSLRSIQRKTRNGVFGKWPARFEIKWTRQIPSRSSYCSARVTRISVSGLLTPWQSSKRCMPSPALRPRVTGTHSACRSPAACCCMAPGHRSLGSLGIEVSARRSSRPSASHRMRAPPPAVTPQ
jgi:hypothetical protein